MGNRLPAWLRSTPFLLTFLTILFALINLLTGTLFGDAPRNLHWGLLTAENPAFLMGAPDTFERIKGFAPDPVTLSENQLYSSSFGSFHRWWGPISPVLFALVWRLTGSYLLLQLVVPILGGLAVLVTYRMARDLLSEREALLAAAFLALFPIYLEHTSTSYTEAISALVLVLALLFYQRGRIIATILVGALAALTKMDVLPLYAGAILGCALFGRRAGGRPWHYHALALFGPFLLAAPWIWLHYLGGGSSGPTRGLSWDLFTFLAPQMLEMLFYLPWYGAIITLVAIGAAAWVGARTRLPKPTAGMLIGWIGMGVVVLLIYSATPGAGNSPRVLIPALPALAILFAAGFGGLAAAWRRRIGFYLTALFLIINLFAIGFHAVEGATLRQYQAAWAVLRERPQGYVLTQKYWETILFSRQKATWFEADKTFERNIMGNGANFAHYVEQNPIAYVILPRIGDLATPDVRAYLDQHAERTEAGEMIVYTLHK